MTVRDLYFACANLTCDSKICVRIVGEGGADKRVTYDGQYYEMPHDIKEACVEAFQIYNDGSVLILLQEGAI